LKVFLPLCGLEKNKKKIKKYKKKAFHFPYFFLFSFVFSYFFGAAEGVILKLNPHKQMQSYIFFSKKGCRK